MADEIRELGAGYRQILRDGWVQYLSQKNTAGGAGQSARRVEVVMKDNLKRVVPVDPELLQQVAGENRRL